MRFKDKRVKIFDIGGDVTQFDQLDNAHERNRRCFSFCSFGGFCTVGITLSLHSEANIKRNSLNVVESIIKNNVKRLVYSSSASVYGRCPK